MRQFVMFGVLLGIAEAGCWSASIKVAEWPFDFA